MERFGIFGRSDVGYLNSRWYNKTSFFLVLFNNAFSRSNCIASNDRMINESGRMWKVEALA
jgi:hypothetical protein